MGGRVDEPASGFICPTCGGALWERSNSGLQFECRIGHRLTAAQMWIEHCVARNRALQFAAQALAENAALARRLATWTREQGNLEAATQLDHEAAAEGDLYAQVGGMIQDLPEPGRRIA